MHTLNRITLLYVCLFHHSLAPCGHSAPSLSDVLYLPEKLILNFTEFTNLTSNTNDSRNKTMQIVRDGRNLHVSQNVSTTNAALDHWIKDNFAVVLIKQPGHPEPIVHSVDSFSNREHPIISILSMIFDMEWVKKVTYMGINRVEGEDCHYFVSNHTIQDSNTPLGEIWVSTKSGKIIKIRNEREIYLAEYLDKAQASVVLPEEAVAAIDKLLQRRKRLVEMYNSGRR